MAKTKIDAGWHAHLTRIGKLGGEARKDKLTPEQMAEHMAKMRAARNKKPEKKD